MFSALRRRLAPRVRTLQPEVGYFTNKLEFAFVKSNLQIIAGEWNCKDRVLDAMQASMYRTKSDHYNGKHSLHKNKILRIAMWNRDHAPLFHRGLDGFVQACNCIEIERGWVENKEGLTKAEIIYANRKQERIGAALTSPPSWFRAPQLLSLYLTLARILIKHGMPMSVNSEAGLIHYLHYLYEAHGKFSRHIENNTYYRTYDKDLDSHLHTILPYLEFILKHEKEIFDEDLKANWLKPGVWAHAAGGVVNFCSGISKRNYVKPYQKLRR